MLDIDGVTTDVLQPKHLAVGGKVRKPGCEAEADALQCVRRRTGGRICKWQIEVDHAQVECIEPLEFRWGTRDLRVASLNTRWVDRATRPIKYFFSVTTSSGDVCILCHSEGDSIWYLESILVV